jgi:hypothetical protein
MIAPADNSKARILTDEMVAKIEALAPRYPNRRALTLPALHIVNAELRHVPLQAVAEIAQVLGLAPAEVQDTLSFYQFFHQGLRLPVGLVRPARWRPPARAPLPQERDRSLRHDARRRTHDRAGRVPRGV